MRKLMNEKPKQYIIKKKLLNTFSSFLEEGKCFEQ